MNQLQSGVSLHNVAAGFVASAEFKALYGASPTPTQFVTKLYDNVLHRAPDAGGFAYWVGAVTSGNASMVDTLSSFSESAENKVQVTGAIQSGIEYIPFH